MTLIIITVILGVLMMFAGWMLQNNKSVQILGILSAIVLMAAAIYDATLSTQSFYNGMLQTTDYSHKINLILCFGVLIYMFIFHENITEVGSNKAEYFALLLFTLCGVFILTTFSNLLMLFLGIEIMSIPQYILAGSDKRNLKSNEASLKYFLMGAFSTGFLLMGITLIYGSTGTFDVEKIAILLQNNASILSYLGIFFLIIAFAFKTGTAPFHAWTPDVYDGSPTAFTPFIASIAKIAVFAAFIKLFHSSFVALNSTWSYAILGIIVLTLLIGNITAVYQQNVKRMLAYSSIAQAGFMLFAVYAIGNISDKAILLYAAAYIFATLGIFAVLIKVQDYTYDGFNGLAKTNPVLAFTAAISLLSMAGIPLTGGFFAKYYMLQAAMQGGMPMWALIFAVLMAAISVYYYFKVIMAMYFKPANANHSTIATASWYNQILIINALIIILLGILPSLATNW